MATSLNLNKVAVEYILQLTTSNNCGSESTFEFPQEIIIQLAEANHNAWMEAKEKDGYSYGPITDDSKKTNKFLVSFSELPEEMREENIRNAKESLRLVTQVGCKIVPNENGKIATDMEWLDHKINEIAESLHDSWVQAKVKAGYTFGEVRNDDPEKGTLTHRDILPYKVIKEVYPGDEAYDEATAAGVAYSLLDSGFAIVKG